MLVFEEKGEKPVRAKERINDKLKRSLFHRVCYIWRRCRDLNLGQFGEKGGRGGGGSSVLSTVLDPWSPVLEKITEE